MRHVVTRGRSDRKQCAPNGGSRFDRHMRAIGLFEWEGLADNNFQSSGCRLGQRMFGQGEPIDFVVAGQIEQSEYADSPLRQCFSIQFGELSCRSPIDRR